MRTKNQNLPIYYFKKDIYRKHRGGKAKLLDVHCANCNKLILIYQKDGPGPLKRCYVDRVFYSKTTKRDGKLICSNCGAIIGTPMVYKKHGENRRAYKMKVGKFKISKSINAIGKD